jgi:peptidoglycan/LPS O-acetylase OafA/YrhL
MVERSQLLAPHASRKESRLQGQSPPEWTKLTRITTSGRFIPEIDGLRFIAIMSVVFCHFLGISSVRRTGTWPPPGWEQNPLMVLLVHWNIGVPLFFVISGFILSLPFAEQSFRHEAAPSSKKYYLRRLTRLEPPYFINLSLLFIAGIVLSHGSWANWPHFLASMAYQHNLIYGSQSTINGVAWSLEVEIQFYFLVPFLAVIFSVGNPRWRRAWLLLAIIAGGLISQFVLPATGDHWNGGRWRMSIANYSQYFLAGFLLADLYLTGQLTPSTMGWAVGWDIIAAVAWVALALIVCSFMFLQALLPLLVVVAYVAAFKSRWFRAGLRVRGVYLLGGMCYTIYLWHQPLMMTWGKIVMPHSWLSSLDFGWNAMIQAFFCIGLVIICSPILFVLLERPFMDKQWHLRLWRRIRAVFSPHCLDKSHLQKVSLVSQD